MGLTAIESSREREEGDLGGEGEVVGQRGSFKATSYSGSACAALVHAPHSPTVTPSLSIWETSPALF